MRILASLTLLATLALQAGETPPMLMRFAVAKAEDIGPYADFLKGLATKHGQKITLSMSAGDLGEMLSWLDRGLVDAVVATPGLFASLAQKGELEFGDAPGKAKFTYLISERYPNSRPDAGAVGQPAFLDYYRCKCCTSVGAPIKSSEDLAAFTKDHRVQFVFVDPLSISGTVLPLHQLKLKGISSGGFPEHFEYSFSHENSLDLLSSKPKEENRFRVAFVHENVMLKQPLQEIEIGLAAEKIPEQAWICRSDFSGCAELKKWLVDDLIVESTPRRSLAVRSAAMHDDCRNVQKWMDAASVNVSKDHFTIKNVIASMRHHKAEHPGAKLALVLTGGGAKCAYQAGAVQQIQSAIDSENAPGVKFDLVVGTSGGAINAVPAAMGKAKQLDSVWSGIQLHRIAVLPTAVAFAFGLIESVFVVVCFVLLAAALTSENSSLNHTRRHRIICAVVLASTLVAIVLWQLFEGKVDALHYAALVESVINPIFLWAALAGSAVTLLAVFLKFPNARQQIVRNKWRFVQGGFVASLLLVVAGGALWLFGNKYIFEKAHTEEMIATEFSKMLKIPECKFDELAAKLNDPSWLESDLVITGSCLSGGLTPRNLYFYAPKGQPSSTFKIQSSTETIVTLERNSGPKLLDVMIGSGALYPVFRSRRIELQGQPIDMVDGGFAHNNPIEAAIAWGATHIIVVEASAKAVECDPKNCVDSTMQAFALLYEQAQIADYRSRNGAVVFSMRPDEATLGTLDFTSEAVKNALARGREDVEKKAIFVREVGRPQEIQFEN